MTSTDEVTGVPTMDYDDHYDDRGLAAALYERVSTLSSEADPRRARSIEQQHDENRRHCDRHGWAVGAVYEDPGVSASRFARKPRGDYARMLADLRGREFDVLVLWEPSRGSRELEGWCGLLNLCRRTGTRIYITSHSRLYDMASGRDWRSLAEDGLDSAYESEKISVRVLRGKESSRVNGTPQGTARYGTRRIYHPVTREWLRTEPDPATAAVAAEIITRVASGEGIAVIRRDLHERGIRSPRGKEWWTESVIGDLPRSPEYAELGIIDAATAAAAMRWHARMSAFRGRGRGQRATAQRFRYSSVMKCSACGSEVRGSVRRGVDYYSCRQGCTYIRCAEADPFIDAMAVRALSGPRTARVFCRDRSGKAAAAEAEALALQQQIDELEESYKDRRIGIGTLERIASELEPRLQAARDRAREASLPSALAGLAGLGRAEVARRWNGLTLAARKNAIRTMWPGFTLVKPPKGSRPPLDERFRRH